VPKVLIVDDDASGTQLLATLLRLEGHEALPLQDWGDPARDVEQYRPDLVIMDVRLGSRSGLDLLEEIRALQDPFVARTPVLMMSVDDHQLQSLRAGANGFIAKPFDLPALLEAIRKVKEASVSQEQ
jgi:DNA-binding response OmpR family regulator